MKRHIWAFLFAMVGLLALRAVVALAADSLAAGKRVLVSHSYPSGLSWTDDVTQGNRNVFDHCGRRIDMRAECLDARRVTEPESAGRIRDILGHKLKRMTPDVLIVSDNAALELILSRRNPLVKEIPIVFSDINSYTPAKISGLSHVTGVAEDVSGKEAVSLASNLVFGASEIIVIGRNSVAANKASRDSFVAALPWLPSGLKVTFLEIVS